MDLDDLTIFQAVVNEGGIGRAAVRLHRVQSNVSTRIRQLEENLGVDLFRREGKRLHPSAAGLVLSGYAQKLLDLAAEARAAVVDNVPRGRLCLGSMESTAAVRLPQVLARFHVQHPAVHLELHTAPTARLITDVIDGQLDCAFVCGPVADARLVSLPVYQEEMVLVAALGHPPITSAHDAASRTLLTFATGCAYRQRLESWLASAGIVPEHIIELASYHALVSCAAGGMGLALVPNSLLADLPAASAVSVHPLPPALAQATTVLIRRAGVNAPAVDALSALLPTL